MSDINLDVLTKTRIGMTVNALRKSSTDEEVIRLSKTLIKNWKKFVSSSSSLGGSKESTSKAPPRKEKEEKVKEEKEREKEKDVKKLPSQFPQTNTGTTDAVRLKCREMLVSALTMSSEEFEGKGFLIKFNW